MHDPEEIIFGDQNYYRIPALIYIKEWKKFLAFAEKRSSAKDEDAMHLVMRTGMREKESVKWSPMKELTKAKKTGYRTMNPCPVFESSTCTLFLFFICIKGKIKEAYLKPGQTRLCYVTIKDGGKKLGKLKDVTEKVVGIKLLQYKTFAVGPGHGIEGGKEDGGSTRLLVPAYVTSTNRRSHSLVLYSTDQGKKWQAGQQLSRECGECQVAEVRVNGGTDAYLYCSARSFGKGAKQVRLEALSDNMGGSFTRLQSLCLTETPHGCQGSVLALAASSAGPCSSWLLFSHPTRGHEWERRDLGVRLRESLQDGGSGDVRPWSEPYVIHSGVSGYSDLAQTEEGELFGCLMECGESTKTQIVYKEFLLSEIKNQLIQSQTAN
ncbi:hypothetical protein ACEWY4_006153 [Coilia grayii]|uniref:exo-alpha-sialidase n=1 Tax=Coilia grayii TaxID=363190 RepID=A0ABD1KD57_9TELE